MTTMNNQQLFAEAWATASKIDGWLTDREARLLFDAAIATPADGVIVEIGSYCGRSMEILAASGRKVICVDPLADGSQTGYHKICEQQAEILAANVARHPNVEWRRVESTKCQLPRRVDLLYIDGNHDGSAPMYDFRHFARKLAPGALVLFHDREEAGPKAAIEILEKAGWLSPRRTAGQMYAARLAMIKCLIGQPHYDNIEKQSDVATENAVTGYENMLVDWHAPQSSILTHAHNRCVAYCLNNGPYEFLAILHSDHAPPNGWLGAMVAIMKDRNFDVLHGVAKLKSDCGHTSTAIAYSDDIWHKKRRITSKELQKLPAVFDITDVRRELAPEACYLLPNTGCMVMRADTWLKDMPPFHIHDKFDTNKNGEVESRFVSEDWNFGFWCGREGLSVGAVVLPSHAHIGPHRYCADEPIGDETDTTWERDCEMSAAG